MATPFLGSILIVGFNFAPRGFAFCNGQLLPISQNTALFSLLGTTYGGNGQTTFALPDLQGRVPIHPGQGAGLSNYFQGQVGGEESHTLLQNELPAHSHTARGTTSDPTQSNPTDGLPAVTSTYANAMADAPMNTNMITPTGGGQPHNNIQPYLALNFVIALQGIFPSRN